MASKTEIQLPTLCSKYKTLRIEEAIFIRMLCIFKVANWEKDL